MWIGRGVMAAMIQSEPRRQKGMWPEHFDHEAGHGGQQAKSDGLAEQATALGRRQVP